MNNLSYLFLPHTFSKTDNEEGFKCLMMSFRGLFKNKTPQQIVRIVQKEEKYKNVFKFLEVFDATLQLVTHYQNEKIRNEFKLSKPDFSEVYELGMLSLVNAVEDASAMSFGYKGAVAKSKKYDRLREFTQKHYNILVQKNPDIKTSVAAYKIYQTIMNEQMDCPVVPSNLIKWLNACISKIKRKNLDMKK